MTTAELPFALIRPKHTPPRLHSLQVVKELQKNSPEEVRLYQMLRGKELLAVDVETNGLQTFLPSVRVVGISFADSVGSLYVDVRDSQEVYNFILLELFNNQTPLMAHNVFFDGSILNRDLNLILYQGVYPTWYNDWKWLNFTTCTLACYKHLASEGWLSQTWGLKDAMKQVLLWDDTNDKPLRRWLVSAGYDGGRCSQKLRDALKQYGWEGLGEEDCAKLEAAADMGQMWRCPAELLGHYCALDADATYLLYKSQFEGLLQRFKAYEEYHRGPFMNLERLLQAQMLTGIRIRKSQLEAYASELALGTAALRRRFLSLPNIQEGVQQINRAVYDTLKAEEPPRYKKVEKLGEEPPKHTVLGLVSKTWEKWEAKRLRLEATAPEERKDWLRWNDRISRVGDALLDYANFPEDEAKELGLFNMASPLQKAQLFYDVLGFECIVWTKPEEGKEPQRSTDADAMLGFGEAGEVYTKFAETEKLLQMITSCLENLIQHNEDFPCDKDGEWYYHPQVKVPGTLTGRLSGSGGVNCQNPPKVKEYLECWTHRGDSVLLDYDFVALEPVVLTELSRDESMLKLYGPGAKSNDVYLFTGMAFPGIKEKFAACGYNPDNPTDEAIKRCKKEHKPLRAVCKMAELSAKYGSGPGGWRAKFSLEGFEYTLEECKIMHKAYWDLYKGVKKWERHLEALWEKNGGWILNGIGRPVCIDRMYLKDRANRCFAGDTLVLTETRGLVHIKDIHLSDRVWTGTSWAGHKGLQFSGEQVTMQLAGVRLTPDHEVFSRTGEKIHAEQITDLEIVEEGVAPRGGWAQVWGLCGCLLKNLAGAMWETLLFLR